MIHPFVWKCQNRRLFEERRRIVSLVIDLSKDGRDCSIGQNKKLLLIKKKSEITINTTIASSGVNRRGQATATKPEKGRDKLFR